MALKGKLPIEENQFLGHYLETFAEEDIVRIGRVFADTLIESCAGRSLPRVVIGFDARVSSWEIQNSLVRGLASNDLHVINLGLAPSPLVLYSMHNLETDGAIMVTGGPRSSEWNGIRLFLNRRPIDRETLHTIKRRASHMEHLPLLPIKGNVAYRNMVGEYLQSMESRFEQVADWTCDKPVSVVVSANHGVASLTAPHALLRMGCRVLKMSCSMGGRAEDACPDPADPGRLRGIGSAVRAFGGDFGVSIDGEGARITVLGDDGRVISSDRILSLFTESVGEENPGIRVVCDLGMSDLVELSVEERNGSTLFTPPGQSFMIEALRTGNALLAGSAEGHYCFADRYLGIPDGTYAALRLVELLAHTRSLDKRNSALTLRDILPHEERFCSPEKIVEFSADHSFLNRFADTLRSRCRTGGMILSVREDHTSAVRVRCTEGWGVLCLNREARTLSLRYEGSTEPGFRRAGTLLRETLRETLDQTGGRRKTTTTHHSQS